MAENFEKMEKERDNLRNKMLRILNALDKEEDYTDLPLIVDVVRLIIEE